jgi:hypothetical protein
LLLTTRILTGYVVSFLLYMTNTWEAIYKTKGLFQRSQPLTVGSVLWAHRHIRAGAAGRAKPHASWPESNRAKGRARVPQPPSRACSQ